MEAFNVLVTSAGRRVSLIGIFRRTLAAMGLIGHVMAVDVSRLSPAFHVSDRSWIVPKCDDEGYVPYLLELCARENVRLLVPTIDLELDVLSRHVREFDACGTTVLVSSPETVRIGNDKCLTHAWLMKHDFPSVAQALPEAILGGHLGDWSFPAIAKPRFGSGSAGVTVLKSALALKDLPAEGEYIIQTLASGQEYTIDLLANRSGRCLCCVPRLRLAVRGGEVSKGMTERQPRLMALATRICEALPGAYGSLNVQIFWDARDEQARVIEINPRFGGGYPLSWQAGAHFPQWLIEEILGRPSSATFDQWRERLVMLRFDEELFLTALEAGV